MVGALRHRGPDEFGLYRDRLVGLGHARLSIIDLATGQQPLCNEDGTIWVVFNGEIFNYVELRADLVALGHRFRTQSDTEVIVHAWEAWGDRAFERFNGQFAIALWDAKRESLVLARDGLGVRPIYLCEHGGRLWFASEVKAIFAGSPAIPRALDPVGLAETFTFWTVVPPQSVFRGVTELEPGHVRVYSRRGMEDRAFWTPSYPARPGEGFSGSLSEAADRVRDALEEAVRLRMLRADVPVGSYLSGGLDSSLVAALGRRVKGEKFCTFSLRFEDAEYDETSYQRAVAALIGSEHREIVVSRSDIAAAFPFGRGPRRAAAAPDGPGATLPPFEARSRLGHQGRADGGGSRRDVRRVRPLPGGEGPALLGTAARLVAPAQAALAAVPLPGALAGEPSRPWRASSSGAGASSGPSPGSPTRRAGSRRRRCSVSSPRRCAGRRNPSTSSRVSWYPPGGLPPLDLPGPGPVSRGTDPARVGICSPRRATGC